MKWFGLNSWNAPIKPLPLRWIQCDLETAKAVFIEDYKGDFYRSARITADFPLSYENLIFRRPKVRHV